MRKPRTIKVRLDWSPEVEAQVYGQNVKITTGSYPNTTRFECTGELSVNCTVRLIKEPHDPDCHSYWECDEQVYCDKHFEEASKENAWMLGVPLSAITGVLSEQDKQDIRDSGRGHLLP